MRISDRSSDVCSADLVSASGSMRAQATMGALSTSAGQALRVCIQFISVVVLSRLLAPEVFGAMAMMMPVVAFVLMFSDLGLSQATVTAREITHRQDRKSTRLNSSH